MHALCFYIPYIPLCSTLHRHESSFIFALLFCALGSARQFEEELAEQMGLYIHAGRGTGNNEDVLRLHK
jgi:hypothetical protein